LLDAAFLAAHARHTGVQISLVLEEIEVSPGHPLGVVGRAVRRAAGRAGEAAAWPEVDLDIQAMRLGVEVGAHHGPWRRQAERLLHQRRIVHACLCILSVVPASSSLAPCSPPSRTLRAAQARWPSAILDRGCARTPWGRQAGTKKRPFSAEPRNISGGMSPLLRQGLGSLNPCQTARRPYWATTTYNLRASRWLLSKQR